MAASSRRGITAATRRGTRAWTDVRTRAWRCPGSRPRRLQRDVAGEPVGDDDVDAGRHEVAALDVADEPGIVGEQRVARPCAGRRPCPASSPFESSPSRGSSTPSRMRAYSRPMTANCTSHSGGAVDGGAAVDEDLRRVTRHRDRHRDRGPGDALDATHAQERGRHRGAGVARAHHRVGLAVAHELGATPRSTSPSCVRTDGRRVVHRRRPRWRRTSSTPLSAGGEQRLRSTSSSPTRSTRTSSSLAGLHRAGDDLARGAVAPHRVDGDGDGHRSRYSTSITWRPPYHPQLPHTMCGCLTAPQFGQVERAGAARRQLEARRCASSPWGSCAWGRPSVAPGCYLSDRRGEGQSSSSESAAHRGSARDVGRSSASIEQTGARPGCSRAGRTPARAAARAARRRGPAARGRSRDRRAGRSRRRRGWDSKSSAHADVEVGGELAEAGAALAPPSGPGARPAPRSRRAHARAPGRAGRARRCARTGAPRPSTRGLEVQQDGARPGGSGDRRRRCGVRSWSGLRARARGVPSGAKPRCDRWSGSSVRVRPVSQNSSRPNSPDGRRQVDERHEHARSRTYRSSWSKTRVLAVVHGLEAGVLVGQVGRQRLDDGLELLATLAARSASCARAPPRTPPASGRCSPRPRGAGAGCRPRRGRRPAGPPGAPRGRPRCARPSARPGPGRPRRCPRRRGGPARGTPRAP